MALLSSLRAAQRRQRSSLGQRQQAIDGLERRRVAVRLQVQVREHFQLGNGG